MIQVLTNNFLAILIAGVVSFVFGALWYSPLLFGNVWAKLQGIKMNGKPKHMGLMFLVAFIANLFTAHVLSAVLKMANAVTVLDAAVVTFWIWLGFFAMTTLLGSVLWEKKSIKLFCLNGAYWLINLKIMALILVLWH